MATSTRDPFAAHRAAAIASQVDLGDWETLIDPTAEDLAEIYASGILEAAPLVDLDVSVDQVNERALEWAQERAAELVRDIAENTRDMLRDTITQALDEGLGTDELADRIAESAGFSEYRAELISRTETNFANNQGNMRVYRDAGVEKKEWLADADAEEECQDNADAGPIPIDDDFPSGDDAPPAHPNCRCSISPVVEPDEQEAADEEE